MRSHRFLAAILAFSVILGASAALADETSVFTNIAPDAMFVTVSSGDYTTTRTIKTSISPTTPSTRAKMLYWHDRRMQ